LKLKNYVVEIFRFAFVATHRANDVIIRLDIAQQSTTLRTAIREPLSLWDVKGSAEI
jgi:hypothetical protein